MAEVALRSEERIGLAVAVVVHAGLLALLLWRPPSGDVVMPPDRIEVTLADDVALTSTSPEPQANARPDIAPEYGEPPEPEPEPAPPEPSVQKPEPVPQPRPEPKPAPKPKPRPRPAAKPSPRPVAKPSPKPSPRAEHKPASRPAEKRSEKPAEKAGGSRIGSDFLKGVAGSQGDSKANSPPAAAIGPAVQASLAGSISRQLKPHWLAPQGADADKLVTILAWNLNEDGSLAGKPRVVGQQGITDANRPQAQRHAEQAIRAVELAAPFDLPAKYYSAWKRVASFRFDRRLSQ